MEYNEDNPPLYLKILIYIFLFLNGAYFIWGLVLLSISGHSFRQLSWMPKEYDFLLLWTFLIITMLLNIIKMGDSVIGFMGVRERNEFLLVIFQPILSFGIICSTVVGVFGYLSSDIWKLLYTDRFEKYLVSYDKPGHTNTTEDVDTIQESFMCCGYKNFTDYINESMAHYYATKINNPESLELTSNFTLPNSCCLANYNCTVTLKNTENVHIDSCDDALDPLFKNIFLGVLVCVVYEIIFALYSVMFRSILFKHNKKLVKKMSIVSTKETPVEEIME